MVRMPRSEVWGPVTRDGMREGKGQGQGCGYSINHATVAFVVKPDNDSSPGPPSGGGRRMLPRNQYRGSAWGEPHKVSTPRRHEFAKAPGFRRVVRRRYWILQEMWRDVPRLSAFCSIYFRFRTRTVVQLSRLFARLDSTQHPARQ